MNEFTQEPVVFLNETDSSYDVGAGIIFRKSGVYDVTITGNKTIVSKVSERKKGKWLCSDDLYETAVCSCCGWDTTEPWQHIKSWFEFCPHCGADMRTR